jgi:hypothetical protein
VHSRLLPLVAQRLELLLPCVPPPGHERALASATRRAAPTAVAVRAGPRAYSLYSKARLYSYYKDKIKYMWARWGSPGSGCRYAQFPYVRRARRVRGAVAVRTVAGPRARDLAPCTFLPPLVVAQRLLLLRVPTPGHALTIPHAPYAFLPPLIVAQRLLLLLVRVPPPGMRSRSRARRVRSYLHHSSRSACFCCCCSYA